MDKFKTFSQGNTAKSAAAFRDFFSLRENQVMAQASINFYRHLQNDLNIDIGMKFCGYLFLFDKEYGNDFVSKYPNSRIIYDDLSEFFNINIDNETKNIMDIDSIKTAILDENAGIIEPDLLSKFYYNELIEMGAGIPGSIWLAFASGKKVYGIIGDGSFAMTSMELITMKKYNLPVKLIVYDNHILGMIKLEEEVMGYPEYGVDLYNPDFSKLAESVGIKGIRVNSVSELDSKLDEFFSYNGPVVLDVVTETNETPMPPK
ncbi:FAD-dependent oxidoreductase, partial [Acidiplasma aeolicum]|uniref:FAD-dependent oxidoreductase n=1 Tax=Acidiplasma aeolicum TaxID=507754 RepID=UPI000B2BA585